MIINIGQLAEGINSAAIDFNQSDIESMWNYLMEDRENFEYNILQYLNNNFDVFDDWKDNPDFEKLYNNLKKLFKE